jgi:tetratricopeptide (TPR) repeat protein
MQKRRETQEQKESAAKKHKMKGNRLFQARRYKDALDEYMTSLRDSPYLAATLGNVAMAHIKLEQWDDAIEFCDRCLHVDDTFVKAYSRRATARIALGLPMEAETDLKDVRVARIGNGKFHHLHATHLQLPMFQMKALKLCPENEDLQRQYDVLKTDIADTKIEKELVEKYVHGTAIT